ncbi:MAG: MFS transporter, partial [Candidatus Binatia bacterium]
MRAASPRPGSELDPAGDVAARAGATPTARFPRVGATVWWLGVTSLLTDVSSEMVSAVLPLYLTAVLQFSALQFGVVDGVYQGLAALLRVWGGVTADRRRCKPVAAAGYGMSAAGKLGLLLAGAASLPVMLWLFVDRLGKGLRTPPRDALIARSAPRGRIAEAFGVHRALDTAGALLGPLLAFALLARAPGAFDAIFAVSLAFAVAGVGALLLLVSEPRALASSETAAASWRAALGLWRGREFRTVLLAGGALSLCSVSDAFLFLLVQRRAQLAPQMFPLLPVALSFGYLVCAIPAGRLADAVGCRRVLVAGYALLLPVYAVFAWPDAGAALLVAGLLLVGASYAGTDGVLMALASRSL